MKAIAVRLANIGRYEQYRVHDQGQEGLVYCLPEYTEHAIAEMLEEIAIFVARKQ